MNIGKEEENKMKIANNLEIDEKQILSARYPISIQETGDNSPQSPKMTS